VDPYREVLSVIARVPSGMSRHGVAIRLGAGEASNSLVPILRSLEEHGLIRHKSAKATTMGCIC
jgi:hypothetical protein